jgi:hypothetical protein
VSDATRTAQAGMMAAVMMNTLYFRTDFMRWTSFLFVYQLFLFNFNLLFFAA